METTTLTLYSFGKFFESLKTENRVYFDGSPYSIKGCKVFQLHLLELMGGIKNNIPIESQSWEYETPTKNEITAITLPPPIIGTTTHRNIFIEGYCSGYQAGAKYIRETYTNPPMMVKDLKPVFQKLKNDITTLPADGDIDELFDCAHIAGQYATILDFVGQYPESFKTFVTPPENKPKAGLTIKQIALKLVYEGYQVTRENADGIITEYGHTSGAKLYNEFTYYSSTANRIGKPNPLTPKTLQNKIELFQSVIPLLSESKQGRAKDELNHLKTIQQNEYE